VFHVEHFVLALVYVQLYKYLSVKRKKRVAKSGKIRRLRASADQTRRPRDLMAEVAGLYRPIKKPVTLRVDADVLAWFRKPGRGYQTRINRALRKVMLEGRKKSDR